MDSELEMELAKEEVAARMAAEERKREVWTLIGVAIIGFLLWMLAGYGHILSFADLEQSGQHGDSFGAANALFSRIAMTGVVYVIVLQRRELAMQREEMRLQRIEMRRSRKELAAQNKLIADQVETMKGSAEYERMKEELENRPLFVWSNLSSYSPNRTLCVFKNLGGRIRDLTVAATPRAGVLKKTTILDKGDQETLELKPGSHSCDVLVELTYTNVLDARKTSRYVGKKGRSRLVPQPDSDSGPVEAT